MNNMKERNMMGKGLQWILFMKNKLLVVFVAVFMGSMPQFIFAYDFQSDGIYYKIKDGNNVAVTKGDTDYSGDVAIPKQIIYNGQSYNVTIIDDEAFRNCTDLTSILIPNSIISIGSFSFQNCSMNSITIPQSVSSVGEFVFTGCKRLTTINVDSDNPKFQSVSGILFDKKQTILYCYPAGKKESNYTIPDGVCSIEEGAFYYCDALTSIVIPNSVTSIDACAFEKCSGFTSITIPNGVISIGNYAFCECSELTTISIPNSVTSIGMFSFYKCSSLTTITIPKSVISIGEGSFMTCKNLTSINVDNDNPQFLSDSGVLYDKDQNSVLCFPNGKKDSKFTIPNRVKTIGKRAFGGCKNLISISIPNSVISIEGAAFEDCINLTSITIPNSVKSIEGSVWWHCPSITSITSVIKEPFEISESVFKSNYSTATLTVPKGTKSAYQSTNYWNKFSTIVESILTSEELTEIHMMKDSCVAMLKIIDQTFLELTEGRDFVPEHKESLDATFDEMRSDIHALQSMIEKCEFDGFDKAISAAFDDIMNKINDENVESPLYTFRHYIQSCSFKCNEGGCINVGSITVRNETRELWFFYSKAFNNNYSIGKEFYITIVPDEGYRLIGNWENTTINSDTVWDSFEVEFEPVGSSNIRTIHVATAGTLPDLISESEKYTIEELTLTGELNGTDFRLLRDMAGCDYLGEETPGKLIVLDISETRIVAGGEKYVDTDNLPGSGGSFRYTIDKADELPQYVFEGCKFVSISLPTSINKISESALSNCYSLTSITIPNSVTSIGNIAFFNCSSLVSITIPESVTSIGQYAYRGTGWYKKQGNGILYIDKWLVDYKGGKPIGIINIEEGTIGIAGAAFFYCSGLTSVTIPNSVIYIGDETFGNCTGLTSVTIPNSVTTIGDRAFNSCSGLTSVTIPNSVNSIGYEAFASCSGLTSVTINKGIIGEWAFKKCSGLSKVTIGNGVTTIGSGAFFDCYSLYSLTIGNNVVFIGDEAFSRCSSLTSLIIPNSVISIGALAFNNCPGLTSLTIGGGVSTIGDYAFYKSADLQDIVSDIKVPFEIEESVFSVYSTAKLTVPKGTKSAYLSTNYWNKFTTIVEAEDGNIETEVTFSSNGITYKGTITTKLGEVIAVGSNSKNLEIPSSVSYDGKSYSVTSIKSGALDGLSLNYLSIPSSVTSLENTIFSKCDLGALIWKANNALSSNVFSNAKFSTASNFLLYVNSASYAPSNVKNVVVGTSANTILLSDNGGNFYCPKEFTAQTISYTHNYSMTTGGNGKGWETLALPFDVQKIEHKTKGTLTPFAKYNSADNSQRPFWLYKLDSNGFKRTDAIKANTPYIISMPNSSNYDSEYILSGDVTFSASNAKVAVTSSLEIASSGSKFFKPAFSTTEKASVIYPLNVSNSRVSNSTSYDAGSRFISNLRTVYPFEAYMTTSSSNARTIAIEFEDDATGIDEIPQSGQKGRIIKVYSLSGTLLLQTDRESLPKHWETLPAGVYIVNGKKIVK